MNRSFPQCHDGQFGFSVRLGKILETLVPGTNLRYTIRFKLRTLDGILADSQWSRVMVTRNLNTPTIDKITADKNNFSCALEMSPTRFNLNMQYTLSRTVTDVQGTSAASFLFLSETTSVITANDSVFSWLDDNMAATHSPPVTPGVIAGVTYNYSLSSTDATAYSVAYGAPQVTTSNTLTCTIAPLEIFMPAAPTNTPTGTGPTCYFAPVAGRANPGGDPGVATVITEWGYSEVPGWTGTNGDNNTAIFTPATCLPASPYQANCTAIGLTAERQYFFAVREKSGAQIGKWSSPITCTPPAP